MGSFLHHPVQAVNKSEFIRGKIDEGLDNREIREALFDEHGIEVTMGLIRGVRARYEAQRLDRRLQGSGWHLRHYFYLGGDRDRPGEWLCDHLWDIAGAMSPRDLSRAFLEIAAYAVSGAAAALLPADGAVAASTYESNRAEIERLEALGSAIPRR